MEVVRYNGMNFTFINGEAYEVETQLPVVQKLHHRCTRCGMWATGGFTRVNAPVCAGGTWLLCAKCLGGAQAKGLIRNGRFRLTAICDEHNHPED